MTSYIAPYLPAIRSLLPRSSPTTASAPEIGDLAPTPLGELDLVHTSGPSQPTLVAFVRHCGCPFAEKEVKLLGAETRKNGQLHVVIVQHGEMAQIREWFKTIGGEDAFPDSSRYTLIADPERKIYAAWGVGVLGWTGMISMDIISALQQLKKLDGIDLTPTGQGSWRWQNSGGFAIDSEGRVRWRKIAKDSSDMCDYAEAAKTVL